MTDVHTILTTQPRRTVQVPELVGVPAADAHNRALDAGMLAVAANATHTAAGRGRIDRQDPSPGAEVGHGTVVRIWIGS